MTQPLGRTLLVQLALGPVQVTSNLLESLGDDGLEAHFSEGNTRFPVVLGFGRALRSARGPLLYIYDLGTTRDYLDSLTGDSYDVIWGLLDGRVLLHDNQTRFRGHIPGGTGCLAFLYSNDDVSVQGNQFSGSLLARDPSGGEQSDAMHLAEIMEGGSPEALNRSFVLYHLATVGLTNRVANNRVSEGRFDSAGSILAHALPADVRCGSAVFNHTTRCVYTSPSSADRTGNLVRYPFGRCEHTAEFANKEGLIIVIHPTAGHS